MIFTYIEGLGKASMCEVSDWHRPGPMRYVWHHIQPQTCGGRTIPANLVSLCDNCHLAVHVLLYQLKRNGVVTPSPLNNKIRVRIAETGYAACVAAGTVDKIPNEGSAAA